MDSASAVRESFLRKYLISCTTLLLQWQSSPLHQQYANFELAHLKYRLWDNTCHHFGETSGVAGLGLKLCKPAQPRPQPR